MTTNNVMERYIQGEAEPSDFDDAVEQWHSNSSPVSLAEFLGMSDAEYAEWVVDPSALNVIAERRRSAAL